MRRHLVSASLLLLGAGLLAGCGQKGPLFLPPTKPATPAPATSTPPPAPASSVPAPAASATSPAAGATSPASSSSG
ncbi:MAG TPA: lipoprotein [Rhodanobacteraceae bacterium]|nr:lipoprotein [Rhodanobacteraceae bacterium]